MRLAWLGVFSLMLTMVSSVANAAYVLEFGQGGDIGLTSFSAVVGETISIDLYISQSGSDTLLSDPGLATMEFTYTISGDGGATHGNVLTAIPTHFNTILTNALSSGDRVLTVDALNGDGNGLTSGSGNSIFLGTATISANQIGTYNFSLARVDSLSFTTPDIASVLPSAGTAVFNVTAVPEPSSFLALGAVAGAGVVTRYRRRKKVAAK